MAVVHFSSEQRKHTDGAAEVSVEAANVRDLFRRLDERYPSLGAHLAETSATAVAIDGEIIPNPMLEELSPDSDVHLVRPLAGG